MLKKYLLEKVSPEMIQMVDNKFGLGNSILLNLSGNKYVFIGESVYEFETIDPIEKFYSMIGRNDVPYPVAVGPENVYFLIFGGQDGYLSKKYFKDFPKKYSWALDSYNKLWGQYPFNEESYDETKTVMHVMHKNYGKNNSLVSYTKKIPKIKIIQKRI